MTSADLPPPRRFGRVVALHSLGWLVAANVIGVWLALVLVWPGVGNLLAPFTYGRWAPLHLNWHLYGACSLPLVGALFAWCLDDRDPDAPAHAAVALAAWSGALLLGGVAWLGGITSGKLFLDWQGWTRPLLPVAMLGLWAVLAWHTARRWHAFAPRHRMSRAALLALLLPVPWVLYGATSRMVYPPVNPDSGGATGASLLGSTLGVVTIGVLLPRWLGLHARRRLTGIVLALAASWGVFAVVDRGSVSHHAPAQILALATLLAWIPLLPLAWFRHAWPGPARPWLIAATAWWAALVASGWVSFLPAFSETLKFTHALVGHAHLALAGFVTSLDAAILVVLTGRAAPRGTFALWQAGCAVYVVVMQLLGLLEARHDAELFRSESWTQAWFLLRLGAGLAMTTGSARWLGAIVRR